MFFLFIRISVCFLHLQEFLRTFQHYDVFWFKLYWQLFFPLCGPATSEQLNRITGIHRYAILSRKKKESSVHFQQTGQLIDGAGAEKSRLLKTGCNVIALFGAGKIGRGILVHEWRCFNECARHIALQHYLHSCCTLESCSMLVSGFYGLTPRKWERRCVIDFSLYVCVCVCVKYEESVSFSQDTQ